MVGEVDLRKGLIVAVNHSGDSDSTGAIAGNILGAIHGEEALTIAIRLRRRSGALRGP